MAAASDYLAEEIILLILSWLPVHSLLRCKAVCKLWNSIISSPKFIQTHLTNSCKKVPSLIRFAHAGDISISSGEHSFRINLPQYCIGMNNYARSCNGLVCVANLKADVICLCNPSTKRFKILPTPKIKSHLICGLTLGLGFDYIENDYKILRIVLREGRNNDFVLQAEVYSSNADSWKRIKAPKAVQSFLATPVTTCVQAKNGVLYVEGIKELLTFDLHNEVLGVLPYPKAIGLKGKSNLLDYEGSVANIYTSVDDESVLSLWMLEDVRGKVSWTKKFDLKGASEMNWIVLYWISGYFIGFNSDAKYMVYDYRKKETKKPYDPAGAMEVKSVVKYIDSLVSLEGFKQLQ